jgi:hypothetical protein
MKEENPPEPNGVEGRAFIDRRIIRKMGIKIGRIALPIDG